MKIVHGPIIKDLDLSEKRNLFLVLFLFFLLRFIVSFFFGWEEPMKDGKGYSSYALAILNQTDWLLSNPEVYGSNRAPGYPIFLAAAYFLFGQENVSAIYFFQAVLSALTVYIFLGFLNVYLEGKVHIFA